MYIRKLAIQNFRCFEETEFEPTYPGRKASKNRPMPSRLKNVNLFLGGNGTGKSSVFKALALSVLAPVIRDSGFNADYSVRRKPGENRVPGYANGSTLEEAELRASLELHDADSVQLLQSDRGISAEVRIQRRGDKADEPSDFEIGKQDRSSLSFGKM